MQPTFHTLRLRLRPAVPADVPDLWALWTDPQVRRFLWDDRSISRDEAAATVADCVALGDSGLGLWVIEDQPAGTALGCAGLLPVGAIAASDPLLAGLVEPLVALAPAAWGQGYAREALAALLGHAAGALGMVRLAGVTDVPNVASDRMLRSVGFRVLGEIPGPRYALRTYLWEPGRDPGGSAASPQQE